MRPRFRSRTLLFAASLTATACLALAYGIAVGRYELFPYNEARAAWHRVAGGENDVAAGARPDRLLTELASFSVEEIPLSPPTDLDRRGGGAIAAVDDGVVGVDKWGEFFAWTAESGVRSLGRKIETNVAQLQRKRGEDDPGIGEVEIRRGLQRENPARWNLRSFRYTDLVVADFGGQTQAVVAYSYWHEDKQCKTLRVSSLDVPSGTSPAQRIETSVAADWMLVYETKPCIPFSYVFNSGFQSTNTGGRLVRLDDRAILFSVGDHHLDGFNSPLAASQDSVSDYGKILMLHPRTGTRTVYALGLRNPQGLFLDQSGKLWESEHGPEGGDELNLIVPGQNYGWPLVTYGRQYNADVWPLSKSPGRHDGFAAPVYSWVPSIAPSNLVRIPAGQSAWSGDLVLSSLKAGSLFRMRLVGDRVVYVEQIRIGARVRDLKLLSDGTLALLVDDRKVLLLREQAAGGESPSRLEIPFSQQEIAVGVPEVIETCTSCHSLAAGSGGDVAPSLWGVVGRDVASTDFASYSPVLRGLGGRWTEDRLHLFLTEPEKLAPGSTMPAQSLGDDRLARAVVNYLARLR